MVNPPPISTSVDVVDNPDTAKRTPLKIARPWLMWFNAIYKLLNSITDYSSASVQAPLTGFSITATTNVLTLTPAGTLATGAITTPANPADGQPFQVSTTNTVTVLTLTANTGQTVLNAPATLLAGTGFLYYYNKAASTWYRLS